MTQQLDDVTGKTDTLCRLMSETIQSLALDATAVRQLTSIAKLGGLISDENIHPNHDDGVIDPFVGLRDIDATVTSMEKKVEALRSIVVEEKRALDQFESSLQEEANSQRDVISNMLDACKTYNSLWQEQHTPQKVSRPGSSSRGSNRSTHNQVTIDMNAGDPGTKISSAKNRKRKDSLDPRTHKSTIHRVHHDNEEDENEDYGSFSSNNDTLHDVENIQTSLADLQLHPVSEEELLSISRNSRGRVTILALNEALEEIETVCRKKYHMLSRLGSQNLAAATGNVSSRKKFLPGHTASSLERRFEYLKQQRANLDLEVDAHAGSHWVSEQELQ